MAGAQQMHAAGDHRRVDRVHVAALRGGQLADMLCLREFFRMVDERRVAALGADQILELLQRRSVGKVPLHGLLGRERRTRHPGQAHDFHAELEHEFFRVLRSLAFEELNGFADFQARAD